MGNINIILSYLTYCSISRISPFLVISLNKVVTDLLLLSHFLYCLNYTAYCYYNLFVIILNHIFIDHALSSQNIPVSPKGDFVPRRGNYTYLLYFFLILRNSHVHLKNHIFILIFRPYTPPLFSYLLICIVFVLSLKAVYSFYSLH